MQSRFKIRAAKFLLPGSRHGSKPEECANGCRYRRVIQGRVTKVARDLDTDNAQIDPDFRPINEVVIDAAAVDIAGVDANVRNDTAERTQTAHLTKMIVYTAHRSAADAVRIESIENRLFTADGNIGRDFIRGGEITSGQMIILG